MVNLIVNWEIQSVWTSEEKSKPTSKWGEVGADYVIDVYLGFSFDKNRTRFISIAGAKGQVIHVSPSKDVHQCFVMVCKRKVSYSS